MKEGAVEENLSVKSIAKAFENLVLVGIVVVLAGGGYALAQDYVILDTGGSVAGKIVSENDTEVIIETSKGKKAIPRGLVRSLVREKDALAPARKADDTDWGYEFDVPQGWLVKISGSGEHILEKGKSKIKVQAFYDFFPILERLQMIEASYGALKGYRIERKTPQAIGGSAGYLLELKPGTQDVHSSAPLITAILIDSSPVRYRVEMASPFSEYAASRAALDEVLGSFRVFNVGTSVELLRAKVSARLDYARTRTLVPKGLLAANVAAFERGEISDYQSLKGLDISLETFFKQAR